MSISGTNEATQSVPFGGAPDVVTLTGSSTAGLASTPSRSDHSHGFNPPACRVYHNANQSLTDNTLAIVAFNSERFDTNTMHDTATNNSRITFTTAGVYVVTFIGNIAAAGDYIEIYGELLVNGTTVIDAYREQPNNTSLSQYIKLATVYKFAATDYVQVQVRQDNAANAARNLMAASAQSPEFAAAWFGLG